MIISPDYFIYENGKYNWSPEKAKTAWKKSFQELRTALIDNSYDAVVLMSGIPGSGKTTWLSKNELKNKIYFDATLTDKDSRAKVIKEIKSVNSEIKIESVLILTSFYTCVKRNLERSFDRQVPIDTMKRMYSKLSFPSKSEGFSICDVVSEPKKDKFTRTHFSLEEWDELKTHPDIIIKSTGVDNISSISFSKDVFYRAAWDDVTSKARGLFVDSNTRKVIMRSYDKFFNLNEVNETQYHMLEKNIKFPLKAYEKYNGYLGLLSWYKNDFLFGTKTSLNSDYVSWFKDIFFKSTTHESREKIKKFLSCDNIGSTLVFEVIDPVNDPHIIKYDNRQLALLDIVYNTSTFVKLSYDVLSSHTNDFNLNVKKQSLIFNSKEEFKYFYDSLYNRDSVFPDIEGYVLEDSNEIPFMFKIKLDNYQFWKKMRSLKDRIKHIKGTNKSLNKDINDRKSKLFYNWLISKTDDFLEKDIIFLRDLFIQETGGF